MMMIKMQLLLSKRLQKQLFMIYPPYQNAYEKGFSLSHYHNMTGAVFGAIFVANFLFQSKTVAIEEGLRAKQIVDGDHAGGAAGLAEDENTILHHATTESLS